MGSDYCRKGLVSLSVALTSLCPLLSYAQTVEAELISPDSLYSSPTVTAPTVPSQNYDTNQAPYPGCVQQLYRVSAYYSPKENQQVYTRNTYTDEIRLNGRGVHGASGMPVYNGMIAAPKSYAFGTKIILPGLGVGAVQDRGGAIVESDGYDRIDIWVGEGDDGLARAKSIGLKWIVGRYCPGTVNAEVGFDWSRIPEYRDFVNVAFWSIDQSLGRQGALVARLQGYLKQVGYRSDTLSNEVFDEQTKALVCRFQMDQLGLQSDDEACGVFGPKTRAALKQLLVKQGLVSDASIYALVNAESIAPLFMQKDVRPVRSGSSVKQTNDVPVSSTEITVPTGLNLSVNTATFVRSPALGEESNEIVVLQKILKQEGLFALNPTGYFGSITKNALMQLQIKHKLIADNSHPAAGYIGPATRNLLLGKLKDLK